MAGGHTPVMLTEVVAAVQPVGGEVYVDATFGAGGYSRALLDAADCRVIAFDRDPDAIARASRVMAGYGDRFSIVHACFGDMAAYLEAASVQAVVFDLGVSSFQLDEAERGFSFAQDGPLDMRMSASGRSAADLVNTLDQEALADLIYRYGEERRSRAIARAIIRARAEEPITTTSRLAAIVVSVLGPGKRGAVHPATRTFQALRIAVNDELGELRAGLEAAERLLSPGGRLVVVSFHSLEDRAVKRFLQLRSGNVPKGSRHLPDVSAPAPAPSFSLPRRGAIKPATQEIAVNSRARSARLRLAIRTDAPAWEGKEAA